MYVFTWPCRLGGTPASWKEIKTTNRSRTSIQESQKPYMRVLKSTPKWLPIMPPIQAGGNCAYAWDSPHSRPGDPATTAGTSPDSETRRTSGTLGCKTYKTLLILDLMNQTFDTCCCNLPLNHVLGSNRPRRAPRGPWFRLRQRRSNRASSGISLAYYISITLTKCLKMSTINGVP